MSHLNSTIVITLNVNESSNSIKKQRLSEQVKEQDTTINFLQETHFKFKNTNKQKVRRWGKDVMQTAK